MLGVFYLCLLLQGHSGRPSTREAIAQAPNAMSQMACGDGLGAPAAHKECQLLSHRGLLGAVVRQLQHDRLLVGGSRHLEVAAQWEEGG